MADEMRRQIVGVGPHAVEKARLSTAQERQPEGIHAWGRNDAAVVYESPLPVEQPSVEPRVRRPEPGRPHDRADRAEIEIQRRAEAGDERAAGAARRGPCEVAAGAAIA